MNILVKASLGLVAVFAIGCGGGGGGGGSSSSGSAAIFLTDDLSTNYDHVWATITKIELGKVGGGTSVVFNDATGVSVDLRSLRDGAGRRFKFIAQDDNLSGQYESVTVTLDDDVVLFPTSATTGLPRVFEGAVAGLKTLTATYAARSFGSGNDDFIIDFDLSTWNENGSLVTGANIKAVAFDNSLNDDNRHERENYRGQVSGLSGTVPNQSFTITRGSNSFTVQCSVDTRIDRSGGNGNPVLANGQYVVVRGSYDATLNQLNAERVKIKNNNGSSDDDDEAYGVASNINAGAGTLDLSVSNAEGFLPVGDPIHVTSNGQTLYRSRAGVFITKDEFFAALTSTDTIEVEGQYDDGSNTLLAKKMKFEDGEEGGEDNGEVTGATSSVNSETFTFKIAATSFSGLNVAPGTLIDVVITGSTTFRGLSGGDSITKQQFFAALAGTPGQLAEVEGNWNGTNLTAFKCKLEDEID